MADAFRNSFTAKALRSPGIATFWRLASLMKNGGLAAILLLGGCAASEGPPVHPLAGTWQGDKVLTLTVTEYSHGSEKGYWTADRTVFRYKTADGGPRDSQTTERCNFSLTGRVLTLSNCRIAGRFTRLPSPTM